MNRSHGKKWCFFKSPLLLLTALLLFGLAQTAAALTAVGAVDPVTEFPVWFQDQAGLRLQLCDEFDPSLPVDEQPPCLPELEIPANGVVAGNIVEALYFAAATGFPGPAGESILAQCVLEAAGPELGVGPNTVGNVALLRIDDLAIAGNYTVVTPCGEFSFNVPNDVAIGARFTGEVGATGLPTEDPPYSGALLGAVQLFASNGSGAPGFLGDGSELTAGPLSGPLRIDGGVEVTFSRDGEILASSNQFSVVGKLSGCTDANVEPTAVDDFAATTAETAVVINVLANDTDVVVDPIDGPILVDPIVVGTVAIVADSIAPVGSGLAVVNADNTITFTPAVGFAGEATFQYTVTDPCGLTSAAATVTVLVEDLQITTAQLRVRTGKWQVRGESSENLQANGIDPNVITLYLGSVADNRMIGTANVVQGAWSFSGKANINPAAATMVTAVSSFGVVTTLELDLR